MSFAAVSTRLKVTGFSKAQEDSIWADLETAYVESATARKMFDDWVAVEGNTIQIKYLRDAYHGFVKKTDEGGNEVYVGTGTIEIDPSYIEGLSYITDHGKAFEETQTSALMHELGHALTGRRDNYKVALDFYTGDNVEFVNTILGELGLPLAVSYIAQSWEEGTQLKPAYHRTGYEYTDGTAIEGAITDDGAWITSGDTDDLSIGGPSRNKILTGAGNDFLVGNGGDDDLHGGPGTDTALFFGNPWDYDVRRNYDGTWYVDNVRGLAEEGRDLLINVEKLRFDDLMFDLKAGGMTFQTDIALVFDTTGSMAASLFSVQLQAKFLIQALFDGETDARVGVVSFKDRDYGDPTTVVLPFTEQNDLDTRKGAAQAAIDSLTASGGGPDVAETSYHGLWTALNGDMGAWRVGAGLRRIVLFTDAPPKDQSLDPLVKSYAESIGGVVIGSSVSTGSGGSLATFELALPGTEAGSAGLALVDDGDPLPEFEPRDDPIVPDTTTATVEIYTIFTSPRVTDTTDLESLSRSTGGAFLSAAAGDDVVTVLLDIIGGLDLVGTPEADALGGGLHIDKLTGLEGNDSLDGGGNADTMIGGAGDDSYAVDHPKDSVVELAGEGFDSVATSLTFYVLPGEVEGGAVSGGAGVALTGNELANLLTGGTAGDVLIGLAGGDRLQGGGGADLLFGGRPLPGQGSGQLALDVGAGNDSIGSAIDLSNLLSLAADPDILDATTVPHVSITGKGYGTLHYFAVGLEVGDELTVDVDRGKGANSFVSIVAADASVLASGNDSAISQGAGGSTSTSDAFVQYTAASAGVHYVVVGRVTTKTGDPNVGEQWASILQPGDSYELQVSVDAPAPAGAAFASGDDRLGGGLGADLLFGGDGVDGFEGTLAELDGDRIGDYGAGERIVVQAVVSSDVAVSWGKGSKVVGIDVTGDGIAEASVTLDVAPDDLVLAGLQLAVLPAGDGTDTSIAFTTPPAGPVVSVAAQSADRAEGDAGTTPFAFAVSLSQASATAETVSWTVAGRGAAPAGAADFAGGVLPSGIVTFAAGETSKAVTVDVLGDSAAEADEGFSLFLSDASAGLTLGAAVAMGTILDDDGPVVAHGDAYVARVGQMLSVPLAAGLLANDEHGSTASLVSGPAHGGLQLVGNGTFTYTPGAGFHGIDTFTYQAGNSGPAMAEVRATIHVVPVQVGASTTLDLLALTAEEQIAATYAAYFGRGADALGFTFWVDEFERGLPAQGPAALFANIASSFGISDEARGLYPFLADPFGASDGAITAFLESVYGNLFDRASDAAGLAYWTGQVKATLQAGQFVGSVLVNIMSGAQDTALGLDITTLMGKVAVSLAYVGEQQEHGTVWAGASDIAAAMSLLEAVTADPASVLTGVREAEALVGAHA